MQKRKKRRVKSDPRLSFCDDIENGSDEDDFENRKLLLTYLYSYYFIVFLPHLCPSQADLFIFWAYCTCLCLLH
jgi:hypothetical protein